MPTTTLAVIECTEEDELYRKYPREFVPQPTYLAIDLRTGTMWCDYDGNVGGGTPGNVVYGYELRFDIPLLTGTAANALMQEAAPLASRILADWDTHWDGQNLIAILGDDARTAEGKIADLCAAENFDETTDLVAVWDLAGVTNGSEVADHGITAATTDEQLNEIATQILTDLAEATGAPVAKCDELPAYLRGLRDDIAESADDEG